MQVWKRNYLTQVIIVMVMEKICINGLQSGTKHLLQRINYSCTLWKINFEKVKHFFFSISISNWRWEVRRSISFSTFHKMLFSHSYLQAVIWTSWLLSIIHSFILAGFWTSTRDQRALCAVASIQLKHHYDFSFSIFLSHSLSAFNSVRLLNTCFE